MLLQLFCKKTIPYFDSKKVRCLDDVYWTVFNVLKECESRHYKSVGIPAISAGMLVFYLIHILWQIAYENIVKKAQALSPFSTIFLILCQNCTPKFLEDTIFFQCSNLSAVNPFPHTQSSAGDFEKV